MSFNKSTNKNYLANRIYGPAASGDMLFKEAIPEYAQRLDVESIITAKGLSSNTGRSDTNAQIVVGRDRWPQDTDITRNESGGKGVSPLASSGYASYHNAGAIDLVVGRGAPYPIEITDGPGQQAPLYTTVVSRALVAQAETLANEVRHDGLAMDAARIYISQMCNIDKYFKLNQAERIYANNGPSSGIVLKADRLRIHARRDVYIHAGGDKNTPVDSCGASFLDVAKIHLMVGNGSLRDDSYTENGKTKKVTATTMQSTPGTSSPGREVYTAKTQEVITGLSRQHPVPRGDNLAQCLNEMLDIIKDGFEMVNNVLYEQNIFNGILANHIHATAAGLTTACPISQIQNAISTVSYVKQMISAFQAVYNNIPAMKMNYLKKSGFKYINSRNVTVT